MKRIIIFALLVVALAGLAIAWIYFTKIVTVIVFVIACITLLYALWVIADALAGDSY